MSDKLVGVRVPSSAPEFVHQLINSLTINPLNLFLIKEIFALDFISIIKEKY